MKREISKLCADSLRTLASEEYGAKLKSAHAHELVAAYFGYRSKNALLADENHPISALAQVEIVVTMPDELFNKRRMDLQELSSDLPDNSILYEVIRSTLVANEWFRSPFPPFSDFDRLAKSLLTRSSQYDAAFPFHREVPLDHFVSVEDSEDFVLLTVAHAYAPQSEDSLAEGYTTVTLPRVAGRIGYGAPELMPTRVSGGMRRTLKSLGVRP
jgi:hypothetical protein